MDLSRPGSDLVGVNEAAALRALRGSVHPLSGREVARIADSSPSSIHRALARLARVGVVRTRDTSHSVLYSINPDHVLWSPLTAILDAPEQVERMVGALVGSTLPGRATALLFGSVARRDASAESDLDLALILSDDVTAAERDQLVDEVTNLIESSTGNVAQVVPLSRAEVRAMIAGRDPLIESWRREAVVLSGPGLAELISA